MTTTQLLEHRDSSKSIVDFRPSKDFALCHFTESQWGNISEYLAGKYDATGPTVVIGNNTTHSHETAYLLDQHGWDIAGIYNWDNHDIDQSQLQSGALDSPIDQSALFAGRHHGNMQDSRDYLAWEEDLPEQIDQVIHQRWLRSLS